MKYLLQALTSLLLLFPILLWSNSTTETLLLYQPQEAIENQQQEINYWKERLQAQPGQWLNQIKLAEAHSRHFQLTADITHLKAAEALLLATLDAGLQDPAAVQRSLARNYISQHRFCEALELVTAACESGSGRRASQLMLFDIYAELGDEYEQYELLQELDDERDFDYLIRLAKWEDSQGRLDHTLLLMDEARDIAEGSQQASLLQWTYSNLGDYHGHAGEIELSRGYYEKALAIDPADWYSMKGLAWILYSHDRKPEAAIRLLTSLREQSHDPGIQLLLAEIEAYTGNEKGAAEIRGNVAAMVSGENYGRMYAAFLCEHYIEQGQAKQAMTIAQKEVLDRPLPASYDLLIQSLFAQGRVEYARQLSREQVWHRTYEPGILVNQLRYFAGVSSPYLAAVSEELSEACFELGPVVCEGLN